MHHAMTNAPEQSRLPATYIQRPPIRRSLSKRKTKSRPHIRGQKTRGTTRKRKITTKTLATISARTTKNSKNKLRDSPPQIKLLSQNLQGDKSGYKMEHLTNVMRDRCIDFLCVQETHLAGTFEKKINEFLFLHHGPTTQPGRGSGGVGIIMSPQAQKAWISAGQCPPSVSIIIVGTTRYIGIPIQLID